MPQVLGPGDVSVDDVESGGSCQLDGAVGQTAPVPQVAHSPDLEAVWRNSATLSSQGADGLPDGTSSGGRQAVDDAAAVALLFLQQSRNVRRVRAVGTMHQSSGSPPLWISGASRRGKRSGPIPDGGPIDHIGWTRGPGPAESPHPGPRASGQHVRRGTAHGDRTVLRPQSAVRVAPPRGVFLAVRESGVPPREHCPRRGVPPGSGGDPPTLERKRTFAGKAAVHSRLNWSILLRRRQQRANTKKQTGVSSKRMPAGKSNSSRPASRR